MPATHSLSFLPLLLLALPPAAPPDVIPAGMKGVQVELHCEPGPVADTACRQYCIVQGDTFEKIAKVQLGNAKRASEFASLNPGIEPKRLLVGQTIWLPPKAPLPAGQEPAFLFVSTPFGPAPRPAPLPMDGNVATGRGGGLVLWIVPKAGLAAFQAAVDDVGHAAVELSKLEKSGAVRVLRCEGPGRLVPTGDPTARRVDTYQVQAQGKELKLAFARSVAFDKDGKEIPPAKGDGGEVKKGFGLLGLSGFGLWLLFHRGRRPARIAPVP